MTTGEAKKNVWLSVVGIGEEGFEVLLPEARRLCEGARHILGAQRHIASLPKDLQARAEPWLSPFGENLTKLDALQKTAPKTGQGERAGEAPPVCVLATGDPLCYGVGATLVRRYGRASMRIVAWRSSFSLAAAAMGWAHDSFATLSLHGRPLGLLQRRLAPCARLLVLLARASDAERIAEMLCAEKLEASVVTILSRLGSSEEQIVCSTAERLRDGLAALEKQPSDLSVLALELPAQPSDDALTGVFGQRLGLPDEAFVHDGQITKRHVRALTLAALVPQRDALLWDVGAGAGSISIEWCLAGGRAVAIERDPRRVGFIEQNRARFALEDRLQLIHASAQDFLLEADKEADKEITKEINKEVAKEVAKEVNKEITMCPQVIFVGGGLDKSLLESLLQLLAPDGRLVANAVSLAGESVLFDAYRRHGGDLTRIAIAHAQPLGEAQAFSPQRCVTQYVYRA